MDQIIDFSVGDFGTYIMATGILISAILEETKLSPVFQWNFYTIPWFYFGILFNHIN